MARKRGVQLADVVGAAAAIADREGVEAVTLARVAAALDIRSPSLYSHVEGLPGLRRAMALDAVARFSTHLDDAIGDRTGTDALRAVAHAYRTFALAHPGSYASMLPAPTEDDPELYAAFGAPLRVIAGTLASVGVTEDHAIDLIRGFRSALHGFVALETGGGFGIPQDVDRSFDALVDLLIAGVTSRSTGHRPVRAKPKSSAPKMQN
jgi:AcrR family transcriptional regulator